MDIQNLKLMQEIQALHSLNSKPSSVDSLLTNDSSTFSNMIQELLSNASLDKTTTDNLSSLLGSVSSSNISNYLSSLVGTSTTGSEQSDATQSLLSSLLYNGTKTPYIPSYLRNNNEGVSLNEYIKDYTGATSYSNLLKGANQYAAIIKKAATTYNIPEKLIASVMKQESNFNASAVSPAGASGLMQLMPGTAKYLGVQNSLDPEQNVMGGAKYLRQMLNKFDNNVSLALAAYNAGPGNVKKYNGIPPFKETTNYVSNILKYLQA